MKKTIACSLLGMAILWAFQACKTPALAPPPKPDFDVIAYYNGNGEDLQQYHWEQLTQVIYSFCHLRGNQLAVDDAADSLVIRKMVALKRKFPKLRVLVALGGWSGCKSCSDVFSSEAGRQEFVQSVDKLLKQYKLDGIDLDWEYPAIEGFPEHPFKPEDKQNFTRLIEMLRETLGPTKEISFAAGGFKEYFDQSIEWTKVMPLVDRVNLMSYDLVGGYSKVTGHHTPLYSNINQERSVDKGVAYLKSIGVPAKKIVLGAAFYARTWITYEDINTGLYQDAKFKTSVPYEKFTEYFSPENGFVFYRDMASQAPYAFSAPRKEFATFDDLKSVELKTKYAKTKGLGGIMFWQLGSDVAEGGLLDAIFKATQN